MQSVNVAIDVETQDRLLEALYLRGHHRWLTFVNALCVAFVFGASAIMGVLHVETGAQAALVAGLVLVVYSLYDGVQAVRWARRLEVLKERIIFSKK